MRGKLYRFLCATNIDRITPAYAGKTLHPAPLHSTHPDHPRVCGENAVSATSRRYPEGSPPRMRGKRNLAQMGRMRDGITPAYAGKTRSTYNAARNAEDHPRVCGENLNQCTDKVLR